MSTLLLILAAVSLAVVVVLALQVAKLSRGVSADREREAGLDTRLAVLHEAVERTRAESTKLLADELRETRRDLTSEQEKARGESRDTLELFRRTLESLRVSLAEDQSKGRTESRQTLEQTVRQLTDQFQKLQQANDQRLAEIQKRVDEKLSETITRNDTLFKGVTDRLIELHATNEKIQRFSQELEELQNVLKAPKLRGELGEIEMERMLRDCLHPDQFETQYTLGAGRVDAVIFNPQGKLPVDSKFPLEAFNRIRLATNEAEMEGARKEFARHVKKHIDDIANKYILPPETLQFAVMYVPAEGVYYELLSNPELMEHARNRGVFPTSPTSFWALLQVTVIGFKGMKISEGARRIAGLLKGLGDDLGKVRTSFDKAANQVKFAHDNMTAANRDLERFDNKLKTIHGEGDAEGIAPGEMPQLPLGERTLWEP